LKLIPAVDLMGGKCVRLCQGDVKQQTCYEISPLEVIQQFYLAGVEKVHVVDLDGAFSGKIKNREIIKQIVEKFLVKIELGGGIRSMHDIKMWLENGIDQVILGTAAVTYPELVKKAVDRFSSDRIIVGVDVHSGKVAIQGWKNVSAIRAEDFAVSMEKAGVSRFIYTDIKTDGMMQGPDITSLRTFVQSTEVSVTAAGGISSLEDILKIQKLENQGVDSVVVGKAIFEGKLEVKETVEVLSTLNGKKNEKR